jgi:sialate O-acetylesterase
MKKILFALALITSFALQAEVTLPKIINSHMVLQRDAKVPIWGWANTGEKVTVTFAGQSKEAITSASGKWQILLDPLVASAQAREMVIQGENKMILSDVLVGEVWLASGQSNMEWSFNRLSKEDKDFAGEQKGNDLIRIFHVNEHITAGVPMDDTIGAWRKIALEKDFNQGWNVSAVGFFFAAKLQKKLGVPVAILDANWGGQRIEKFIAAEGYEETGLKFNSGKINKKKYAESLHKMAKQYIDAAKLAEKGIMQALLPSGVKTGKADNDIYNAMIAPLAPYAIKGAIWYQGESNRTSKDYYQKVKALSAGWSKVFNVKGIPLYQVQIAPYTYDKTNPKNSTLCDNVWAAQYKSAKEVPGVEVVCIHDTNIPINNIHPAFKQPVGERLAAMALKKEYKQTVVASGPEFSKATFSGTQVTVSFHGIDQGLITEDGKDPNWFELSSDGESFVSAKAEIIGNTVLVSTPAIKSPKFVRMGWYETAIPNLKDKNGWPVFAFPAQEVTK